MNLTEQFLHSGARLVPGLICFYLKVSLRFDYGIRQLRAEDNARCPAEMWWAAAAWLHPRSSQNRSAYDQVGQGAVATRHVDRILAGLLDREAPNSCVVAARTWLGGAQEGGRQF
jgi:hypothetical protein